MVDSGPRELRGCVRVHKEGLCRYVSSVAVASSTLLQIDAFTWADMSAWCLTEESLLVLQGIGIQTSTSSSYFFTSPTTTFIPTTQIQDIVIHEAFKGLEVRFYLAVIVEGASEVVVVFPVSLGEPLHYLDRNMYSYSLN